MLEFEYGFVMHETREPRKLDRSYESSRVRQREIYGEPRYDFQIMDTRTYTGLEGIKAELERYTFLKKINYGKAVATILPAIIKTAEVTGLVDIPPIAQLPLTVGLVISSLVGSLYFSGLAQDQERRVELGKIALDSFIKKQQA